MRKLLLASVATLGFAGSAYAAALVEINPTTSPPAVGTATGVPATGFMSAFSAPKTNPDPGNVIVRFDGMVAFDTGFASANGNVGKVYTAGVVTGSGKLDAFQNNGYFRLYGGIDGKLLNGIIYGANFEMRTNFAGGAAGGYTTAGATINNGSSNSTASLWYTRRAFAYVGGANWGLIRYGQGDGPLSLFTGAGITTGEAFSTGAWDGDIPDLLPGNSYSGWAFNDIGNEYTQNKIVYISPSIFGVNFAVSFAPNSSALAVNTGSTAAGGGNIQQSSSVLLSDQARPRNIFETAVRWQGTFGPVAIDSMFGIQHSAVVNNGSAIPALSGEHFKGLDTIDGGASVTVFGASVYGHVFGGTMNGTGTPVAVSPTRGAPKAWSWVEGVQYSIGPWTAGASYWSFQNEGTLTGLGMQSFRGVAVGGYYAAAPSWNIFAEYLHGQRHQAGVNFVDSGTGVPAGLNNNVSTNGFALSSVVTW